jgi:hypothetical protein
MTTETPPEDWVLLEAARRSGWPYTVDTLRFIYIEPVTAVERAYRALCDMIAKHEKLRADRKVLCADQAIADWVQTTDDIGQEWIGLRAIELYEEGFGK